MSGDNNKIKESTGSDLAKATTAKDDKGKTSSPNKIKTAPRKTGGGVFVALFLLLCAAIGALTWYGWVYQLQPQQQRLQALEQSLAESRNDQLELSRLLSDQQQVVANDQKVIEQRLEAHDTRLRNLAGTSRNDWMLAEAKYLMRLANQRLLMERGTTGAQALLESADNILMAIDAVDLFVVRDALAKDIMALKLAPTIDREGIYLQLLALIDAVEKLPPVPPAAAQPSAALPTDTVESRSVEEAIGLSWSSRFFASLKDTFADLGQFIKIRHHDEPPEPLLSDEYQANLIYNLRLMFEQAQLALLREQSTIYWQSLEQAKQWLDKYYVHYPEKTVLVEQINSLQEQSITQVLPDIWSSLEQITDYIDRYHKLTPEVDVNDVEDSQSTERPMVPPDSGIESKGVAPQGKEGK